MVSHVAGTRAEGRFCLLRFERSDLSGLAIVSILQDRQISFYVGDIDVFSIRGKEYAMGFLLSFVDCGDGFPGNALIVEGIDIEPSISIAHSKDMSVFLVQAQVAGSVIKIDVLMFLVGTVLI